MEKTIKAHFGPNYKEVLIGDIAILAQDKPLQLDCGMELFSFPIAYKTYGKLNAKKNNVILICHGLTADQYVAGRHPVTGKRGWWDDVVGPKKNIDTDKFFVVSSNVLGGCMGSYGSKSINPKTGQIWGLDFPVITINDMVNAQKLLLDYLGISEILCVIGGSMGGMLTIQWSSKYKEMVRSAVFISTAARHTAQNIAFHEIGRQAIMADPDWVGGKYYLHNKFPAKGLAVARMTAHVTYMSETSLNQKFGRQLQNRQNLKYDFDANFQVESYLRHQGVSFVDRFDPNCYLYITKAMDYFDIAADYDDNLANAFVGSNAKICVISFSSDWLMPTSESKYIVQNLNAASVNVTFIEIQSDKGHDAFLLDEPEFFSTLGGFINSLAI